MKEHSCLAVANRPQGTVLTRGEITHLDLIIAVDIAFILFQDVLSVLGPFTAKDGIVLIGQVGGQTLAPVAVPVVHVDRVPEPGVEYFMAQRDLRDKR